MVEPLRVNPAALSGAGSSIAGLSPALEAAVGSLIAAYNADTGQDAAGTAFGLAYQDSAKALVSAVAQGVNALRHVGYLIQVSATNYSRAEAAADIRGAGSPLPPPVAPPAYAAPGGTPDVNGPGQTPPVLWYLVEALVGDLWPNGEPNELRVAAAAWNAFASPLYGVTGQNAGAYGMIGAQQMPDKEPMQAAVRDVGTAMASLAGEAQHVATQLSGFASDVETAQNAIRDLLNKLASVVGSVIDKGILGTIFELVTDDADEKIREVADDIKAVVANHKRQSAARKDLLAQLVNGITNSTRAMEILLRVEMVNYLGEDTGRVAANITDAFTDATTGAGLQAINAVGGLVTSFDPIGDPKGTWAAIESLGKQALTLNPMTAPVAFATDPQGSIDIVKDVTHFDEIVTSDRPFLEVGKLGFDVGTAIVPGGAAAKAGAGARAAEGAAARGEVTSVERAAGQASKIATATDGLRGVATDVDSVTAKLDELNKTPLDGAPPPAGSPGPLPRAPEPGGPPAPRDPVPSESGPAPTGGKPTSAPSSADPVPSPVAHSGEGVGAPRGEVPSAPGISDMATATGVAAPPSQSATSAPALPEMPRAGAAQSVGLLPHESLPGGGGHQLPHMPSESPVREAPTPHGVGPHEDGPNSGGSAHPEHNLSNQGDHAAEADRDGEDSPAAGHEHHPPEGIPPLLVRDTPFETVGIKPRYVGEQWPGGPMGWPGVTYLDDAGRELYRITIHDGLVYDSRGQLFDTSNGVSAFGPGNEGRAIFVMDEHGNLYASTYQEFQIFHHSSLLAGGEVASAGELIVKDGRIELLTDRSGHYMPGRSRTLQVLEQLAGQGIVLDPAKVEFWAPEGT